MTEMTGFIRRAGRRPLRVGPWVGLLAGSDVSAALRTARGGRVAAALLALLSAAPTALADEWINPGAGDWFDNANWLDNSAPTGVDMVEIDNGGTVQVLIPGAQADGTYLGISNVSPVFLEILSGGTLSNNLGVIGMFAGSTGTATVDGAGSTWTNGLGLFMGDAGAGTLTLTNGGAVNVDGGNGTLTLGFAAGGSGTLNIGNGGAAGIVNAAVIDGGSGTATLNFNHTDADYFLTTDGTVDGTAIDITGSTAVNFLGSGVTTLTGTNTYTGATTVDAGTLIVNGSISNSATTVNAGGTLGGTGTLGDVALSGGTLSPGNSIGTLNVAGDYTHDSSSTLEIEINNGGNTPGTNVDLLNVTGTATLNGGTVEVFADPGTYTPGTQYTFLTAGGGVTGTFDAITNNLFTLELSYLANSAYFTLMLAPTDYESLWLDGDLRSVGRAIDLLVPTSTGDLAVIFNELGGLSDSGARDAVQQLSGETIGAGTTAVVQNITGVNTAVFNRIRSAGGAASAAPAMTDSTGQPLRLASANAQDAAWLHDLRVQGEWVAWVQGYGEYGEVDGSSTTTGFDYWTGGLLVGADRRLDDHWLLGGYGGYARSGVDSDFGRQDTDIDHYQLGLYTRYDRDDWYALGSVFAGYQRYDAKRRLRFGGIDREADSDYDGAVFGAAVELGRTYEAADWTIQPLAGLQYVHVHQESYTESGAGAANLQVGSQNTDSLQSSLGVSLSRPIFERSDALLYLSARWNYEFLDDSGVTTARFAGSGGDTFTVDSASRGRHSAQLGAGVSWQLNDTTSLGVQYDAEFNQNFATHAGMVSLNFVW